MRITLRPCTVIGLFLSLAPLSLRADMTPYLGRWQVNVPATLDRFTYDANGRVTNLKKAKPETDKTPIGKTLTLTADKLSLGDGSSTFTIHYTFKDRVKEVTTITSNFNGKVIEFTLTTISPKQISVTSSESPWMDDIIWTPAPPLPPKPTVTIEDNLSAIQQAVDQYSLEMAADTVPYDALVKGNYFKPLQIVNGENYATVIIDVKNRSVSVTDKDGITHTFKKE